MDKAVEPEVQAQIERTLARFADSSIRFDHMRDAARRQRRFLDLHMHMPANWTLGRAAALRGEVEQALMGEVPGLRASIQLLPSNVEAQFNAVERRAVIALVQRVARGAGRGRRQRRRRDRPRARWSSSAPSPTTARRSPTGSSPRCSSCASSPTPPAR